MDSGRKVCLDKVIFPVPDKMVLAEINHHHHHHQEAAGRTMQLDEVTIVVEMTTAL